LLPLSAAFFPGFTSAAAAAATPATPQAAKAAGGPTRVEKAKIGLIQFQLSPPKADIESSVVISDYQQASARARGRGCSAASTLPKVAAAYCTHTHTHTHTDRSSP
jgi:hypothetical protein